jgi:hypothetical protein
MRVSNSKRMGSIQHLLNPLKFNPFLHKLMRSSIFAKDPHANLLIPPSYLSYAAHPGSNCCNNKPVTSLHSALKLLKQGVLQ